MYACYFRLQNEGCSIDLLGASLLGDALKLNSTLIELILCCNKIGASGALALSDSLKSNKTLTTLQLQDNSIGDLGGTYSWSDLLKSTSALTTLDLTDNQITYLGASSLSESLKSNSTLTTLNLCNPTDFIEVFSTTTTHNRPAQINSYIIKNVKEQVDINKGLHSICTHSSDFL